MAGWLAVWLAGRSPVIRCVQTTTTAGNEEAVNDEVSREGAHSRGTATLGEMLSTLGERNDEVNLCDSEKFQQFRFVRDRSACAVGGCCGR